MNGARARWTVSPITAGDYLDADHANQTLWVGANGRHPMVSNVAYATWVEVGDLKGSQNGDLQNHWTYYTSRGINCTAGCVQGQQGNCVDDVLASGRAAINHLVNNADQLAESYSSLHSGGGAGFVFADGSVHFLKNSINNAIWYGLQTVRNREIIGSDQF